MRRSILFAIVALLWAAHPAQAESNGRGRFAARQLVKQARQSKLLIQALRGMGQPLGGSVSLTVSGPRLAVTRAATSSMQSLMQMAKGRQLCPAEVRSINSAVKAAKGMLLMGHTSEGQSAASSFIGAAAGIENAARGLLASNVTALPPLRALKDQIGTTDRLMKGLLRADKRPSLYLGTRIKGDAAVSASDVNLVTSQLRGLAQQLKTQDWTPQQRQGLRQRLDRTLELSRGVLLMAPRQDAPSEAAVRSYYGAQGFLAHSVNAL